MAEAVFGDPKAENETPAMGPPAQDYIVLKRSK
jgi:hypothetical protein